MESSPSVSLIVPVPRPPRGASARVRLGSSEVVFEAVRGGYSFLWSNGRTARRHALGLATVGHLTLELRAPKLPVRVTPRDVVTVVGGGRLHGYVQVGLVPTLVWHDERGDAHVLIEIPAEDQTAEWDERTGHSLHAPSPWFVRFPMRNGEPRAVVPIRVVNRGDQPLSPAHFEIQLRDTELRAMRGSIVAPPRRVEWAGEQWQARVRAQQRLGVGA